MTSPEYLEKIKQLKWWYYNLDLLYESIQFLQNREFAGFIPKIYRQGELKNSGRRFTRCHNVQNIKLFCDYGFRRIPPKLFNFYYSACIFQGGIPIIRHGNRDYVEVRKEMIKEWNDNCHKKIIHYDWLIDIDSDVIGNIDYAHDTLLSVKEFFDRFKVPYEVRFSGCGFHLVVPYEFLEELNLSFNPYDKDNLTIYTFLTRITKKLNSRFSEMIDYGIFDLRRVIKLPYTLTFYSENTYLCTPLLSDKEIKDFDVEKYTFEAIKDINFKNRGTFMFNDKDRGTIKDLMTEL